MARQRKRRPLDELIYSRTTDRRKHLQRCPRAYLDPNPKRPLFPIAPKHSCTPMCRMLEAARRRGNLVHRPSIAKEALDIARRMGCPWATKE